MKPSSRSLQQALKKALGGTTTSFKVDPIVTEKFFPPHRGQFKPGTRVYYVEQEWYIGGVNPPNPPWVVHGPYIVGYHPYFLGHDYYSLSNRSGSGIDGVKAQYVFKTKRAALQAAKMKNLAQDIRL